MLLEHVVGNNILLPGVGYVELALAVLIKDDFSEAALQAISVVRPCFVGSCGRVAESLKMRHRLDMLGGFDIAT